MGSLSTGDFSTKGYFNYVSLIVLKLNLKINTKMYLKHSWCLILVINFFSVLHASSGDEVAQVKKEGSSSRGRGLHTLLGNADIIKQFFANAGINLGDSIDAEFIDRYDDDVVEKMSTYLEKKNNPIDANLLDTQINSMIHKSVTRKIKNVEIPFKRAHEAILQALDLIVPDSESEPIYKLAKRDLRAFFKEQPELGLDLIERVGVLLEAEKLEMRDATEFLLGCYYNWIPFGRLAEFIDKNGST